MEKKKQVNNKKIKNNDAKTNKQFRLARSIFTALLGLTLLSGVAVFASKGSGKILSFLRPSVDVSLSGTVSRDSKQVDLSKADSVKPGEILRWTILSENKGDGDASGYKTVGQIPKGTEFIAGSANGEKSPVVKYSIDNGQNFSKKPMIKERQEDGSEKLVPAPASLYTQIQFEWEKSLKSGGNLKANYSVRVK